MATVNTDWQPADSDNNLLRKLLTRLNTGIIVDDIHLQDVTISNPIGVHPDPAGSVWKVEANATFPVSGTVNVGNLPVTQPVSGTVAVSNLPVTQPVSGTVAVSNFPVTQPVSGTVAVSSTPFTPVNVAFPITAVDAFQRLRVASPSYVFDSQLTYDLAPTVFEAVTNGSGATITHDATNRMALMTFSSTPTGGKAFMQTYDYFRYQPGRAQSLLVSFNFLSTAANTVKFVGYSDGVNGVELQQSGSTVQLALLSGTSVGNQIVTQANWNVDKLDGTGISGITLDLTKTQIFVMDMQALYSGRVRVGFDIGGLIVPIHQFNDANILAAPYIQNANLPVRCGMTCTGTVSTTMNLICATVSSSGGQEDVAGYSFTVEGTGTAGNGTAVHLLSLRPKTTFNSITNRAKFALDSVEVTVTGANPVSWQLVVGQAISGTTTFTDVNATYSAAEFNTAGTISGSAAISLLSGYVASGASTKASTSTKFNNKLPLTLDAAGVQRLLGTLSIIATGIGGTSATRVRLNWREIR